jgi:hypothetical protein
MSVNVMVSPSKLADVPVIESQCIDHPEVTDSFDLDSSCHLGTIPWNRYQEYTSHLA